MVRHAHTPQGLAYRDGSGLACVLADFGSAKMLPPLNAAATELVPHVDHVFAATRFGQLALQGLLAGPASLHPSEAWATTAGHIRRPCLRHIGTSRPGRARASRTSAHGRTAHPSSSTAQNATAASPTVRVRVCACVATCFRPSTRPSGRAGPCVRVDARSGLLSPHRAPSPSRTVWSLGCLLCDILLRGSMCRNRMCRPCSSLLACIDLRAPRLATPDLLWASGLLRTLQRRGGASPPPHGSLPMYFAS